MDYPAVRLVFITLRISEPHPLYVSSYGEDLPNT